MSEESIIQRLSNRYLVEDMIGIPGRVVYGISNTTPGKYALASIAGLVAARAIGKKMQEKEDTKETPENQTEEPKKKKKLPSWLKGSKYA
jgi:hypothetical protein